MSKTLNRRKHCRKHLTVNRQKAILLAVNRQRQPPPPPPHLVPLTVEGLIEIKRGGVSTPWLRMGRAGPICVLPGIVVPARYVFAVEPRIVEGCKSCDEKLLPILLAPNKPKGQILPIAQTIPPATQVKIGLILRRVIR